MKIRPSHVLESFAGRCKNFPETRATALPYQMKWLTDRSRLKLVEKGRQLGMTRFTAEGLLARKSLKDARLDAWISSRDDLQARLFLKDCKTVAEYVQVAVKDLGLTLIDKKGNTAYALALGNGLQLHSMSSNPDAQAGKRGDRVLDEFALHPDPRQLYNVAYPGITWGGSLEILSTHRGTGNFFNELVQEARHKGNPKGFSLHRVTLQDALDEGFLYKLQAKLPVGDQKLEMDEGGYFDFVRAGCADEGIFRQEYMCDPEDESATFMPHDLIAKCEYREGEAWEKDERALARCEGTLYVGVDVGRERDLTVIWVLEQLGDTLYTRQVVELDRQTFDAQEEALYAILKLRQVRRCCIDCTGIGRQFTERAQARFGEHRVERVNFTAEVKEMLAYPLRSAFEERTVRIPNRAAIRADLRAIRKETTVAGNLRFVAERGTNGHADRFWALALAKHAAGTRPEPGFSGMVV